MMETAPHEVQTVLDFLEDWLAGGGATPDPMQPLGAFGRLCYQLRDWQPPIVVQAEEMQRWHDAGFLMTREDFDQPLADMESGFLEVARADPQRVVDLILEHLGEMVARMRETASLPLSFYVPREIDEEDWMEGEAWAEQEQFDRPFSLAERLLCFNWGLEKARATAITAHAPVIGLPNRELFEELSRIKSHDILQALRDVEPQQRAILEHLAGQGYYELADPLAPQVFWWRHYRAKPTQKPQERPPRREDQRQRGRRPRPTS
ncbi:hypothetical protein JNJ66_05195 [Candidatus Saccharibacteria bacterium]|nr:hypothetical protein [Candidatus Saccharibacteria bacterium]